MVVVVVVMAARKHRKKCVCVGTTGQCVAGLGREHVGVRSALVWGSVGVGRD